MLEALGKQFIEIYPRKSATVAASQMAFRDAAIDAAKFGIAARAPDGGWVHADGGELIEPRAVSLARLAGGKDADDSHQYEYRAQAAASKRLHLLLQQFLRSASDDEVVGIADKMTPALRSFSDPLPRGGAGT